MMAKKISEYCDDLREYLNMNILDDSTAYTVKMIINDLSLLCQYFETYEEYLFLSEIYSSFFSKAFFSGGKQYIEECGDLSEASSIGLKGTTKFVLTMLYQHLKITDGIKYSASIFFKDLNDIFEHDDTDDLSKNDQEKLKDYNYYLQLYIDHHYQKKDYVDYGKVLYDSRKVLLEKALKFFDYLEYKTGQKKFLCDIDDLCEIYLSRENVVEPLRDFFSLSLERDESLNALELEGMHFFIANIRMHLFSPTINEKNVFSVGEISEYKRRKSPLVSVSVDKSYNELVSEINKLKVFLREEIEPILEINWIKSRLFEYHFNKALVMPYREFGKKILSDIKEDYDKALAGKKEKACSVSYDEYIDLCFPGKNAIRKDKEGKTRYTYDCVVRYNKSEVSFYEICDELAAFSSDLYFKEEVGKLVRYTARNPIHDVKLQTEYDFAGVSDFIKLHQLKYSVQELVNLMSFIGLIEEFNFPKYPNVDKYRGRKDCFGRFIESLYGGEEELNKIKGKLSKKGEIFKEQNKYRDFYCSGDIDKDRWHLEDFDSL